MFIFEILKAIFLGIIEGITEWLPISSTGHMILFNEFVKLDVSAEFMEMLLVVIQLGAICAVPILFFDKLNPFSKKKSETERKSTWSLWLKVLLGVIPAGVVGLIFDDFFNAHFYNFQVVTLALVIYGVAFIVIELINKTKRKDKFRVERVEDITYVDALK
ncbi:MAG: undecaprenyl-diphosphatase, partial [Clostridia bacterium]|nr:undecaprenyl-diphosphatase [Clostridia bacterium]